jgi:hypothetical protein
VSRTLRFVLDPPLDVCGITRENHGCVDLECELEGPECYEWFVNFVKDRLVMAERWEDGQEG